MARDIIESNRYMVLGSADEARARPDVSIVIFDSQVAVGSARAV